MSDCSKHLPIEIYGTDYLRSSCCWCSGLGLIPTPGIDGTALTAFFEAQQGSILRFFNMFTGGALARLTIFALGVMPYISASIIMQHDSGLPC